jgi:hypothetical protein
MDIISIESAYLDKTEKKGEITVDAVFLLENKGSLDPFPSAGNLDKNTFLGYTFSFVHRNQL